MSKNIKMIVAIFPKLIWRRKCDDDDALYTN